MLSLERRCAQLNDVGLVALRARLVGRCDVSLAARDPKLRAHRVDQAQPDRNMTSNGLSQGWPGTDRIWPAAR